jgi:hypothetical protein
VLIIDPHPALSHSAGPIGSHTAVERVVRGGGGKVVVCSLPGLIDLPSTPGEREAWRKVERMTPPEKGLGWLAGRSCCIPHPRSGGKGTQGAEVLAESNPPLQEESSAYQEGHWCTVKLIPESNTIYALTLLSVEELIRARSNNARWA